MECLDANAVQDLMAGALDVDARAAAMEHLDGCTDCRDLISLLARAATHDAAIDTLRADPLAETAGAGGPAPAAPDRGKPARAATPSQAGRVLGRYTLAERLGAGAMGVVYRAVDRDLGRSVAVKLLHRPDSALTDRLVREARSMAQVNHPNVVAVYDVGVDGGTTYIAMELVTGASLRAWQQARRAIPELLEAYLAAGRGLAAAHAAGIVHRDFKPDNVLVGDDGRVRVTDFGLAAARPSDGDASPRPGDLELTTSGVVLGTPAYMAPEQFTGGNIDPRTDQFNFCVALYEALYGARPFRGKTFEELGDNVCEGKVLPPPADTQVSRALRAIVLRGLSARPGDRYPTMDHLLVELARDRARPWRRASGVAAALALLLGVGLATDVTLRDRVSVVSRRAFDDTGKQIERAFGLLARSFDTNANQMYLQPAMREAAAHKDEIDFGFGSAEADAANLETVHSALLSTDWTLWSQSVGTLVVAVADYKGRLLYTSAAPNHWRTDLTRIPWIGALTAGKERTITLQRTGEPRVAESGILGPAPAARLGFFFARTLVLNQERRGYLVQAVDADQLLRDIELDDETLLTIVDLEGVHVGAVPAELAGAAPRDGSIAELHHGGTAYQVKAQALVDLDGRPVGHVVMARELGGVLSGLFPGARVAFALAMLAALAAAAATALRARRITGARA
jgi:predicted Ser/Thr protein kinase